MSVITFRINPHERALIEAAADEARTNLSDYVRRKAVEAAELELLGRTNVTIPAENWEQFEAWLRKPTEKKTALDELARSKPTWQK